MPCFILVMVLSLCLQGCGGDASFSLYLNWGSCDFDRERWAHADRARRGCMLDSFFRQHRPERMSAAELMLLLGAPTGQAGEEELAYAVLPAGGGWGGERLLVFRVDRATGRIVDAWLRPPG